MDERPDRRNKAVFSNLSCGGRAGTESNKPFRKFSYHRAISSLFQALNIKTDLKEIIPAINKKALVKYAGPEWHIFHILTTDIDDVANRVSWLFV